MTTSRAYTLVLLGLGRLGQVIQHAAHEHDVPCLGLAGAQLRQTHVPEALSLAADQGAVVVVDASVGEAVDVHLDWALEVGAALVVGTTGHELVRDAVEQRVNKRIGVLMAPNFAPGALLLGRVAEALGGWCGTTGMSPFLEERHHAHKKDAPSGTALWLKERLESTGGPELPITATRAGHLPGSHLLGLHAKGELLEFRHTVLGRETYGAGAIAACEFVKDKRGVFGIEDWAREMYPWP